MNIKKTALYGIMALALLSLLAGIAFLSGVFSPDATMDEPLIFGTSNLVEQLDDTELGERADITLIGSVKEILPSKWNTVDGRKPKKAVSEFEPGDVIYTDVVISVDRYVKNPLPTKEVTVRVLGGTVGEDSMKAEDEPSFTPGEKVMLFLGKDDAPATKNIGMEHLVVTGLFQGKFTLTDDGKAVRGDRTTSLQELLDAAGGNTEEFLNMSNKETNKIDEESSSESKPLIFGTSNLVEQLDDTELGERADITLIGSVKEILPSKWNTVDGRKPKKAVSEFEPGDVIYTDVVISVDRYVKNPLPTKEVTVRVLGGTVGEDSMKAEDEPSFTPGEKVMLFLGKDDAPATKNIGMEHLVVTGLFQGKFTLTDDGKAVRGDRTTSLQELLDAAGGNTEKFLNMSNKETNKS